MILYYIAITILDFIFILSIEDNAHLSLDHESTLCSSSSLGGAIALGMESGAVLDSAISASSSYNEQSTGPQLAR